jgi:hypothetical protein
MFLLLRLGRSSRKTMHPNLIAIRQQEKSANRILSAAAGRSKSPTPADSGFSYPMPAAQGNCAVPNWLKKEVKIATELFMIGVRSWIRIVVRCPHLASLNFFHMSAFWRKTA